jgi:lipopolysaccharide transport system ATP-binding protein
MSSDRIAISVDGLSKSYRLGANASYGRLTESLSRLPRRFTKGSQATTEEFWALSDVSLDVSQGEVVGIVGRNGAGKSTLLKILSQVTRPTSGSARLRGRVGSLLEVGTGFHPELTGRENINMSGAILGMRRREIDERFNEIVEFADIGPFLDTPVKRYSSGMQVRLGFAVAAHLDSEILLVDEVLAVGDSEFQRRSQSRMSRTSQDGRTILFVSHNLAAVKNICPRSILINNGTVAADQDTQSVIDDYLRGLSRTAAVDIAERTDRNGDRSILLERSWIEYKGSARDFMVTGEPATLVLAFIAQPHVRNVEVSVGLFDAAGAGSLYLGTKLSGYAIASMPTRGLIKVDLDKVALLPGTYYANTYITSEGKLADWLLGAFEIRVEPGDFYGTGQLPPPGYGQVAHNQSWSVLEA